MPFVLTWFPSHEPLPEPVDAEVALGRDRGVLARLGRHLPTTAATTTRRSTSRCSSSRRSPTQPTGGIVAAPTTSLPERIGGVRNWDYRYCWLRDATLTLLAMLSAGYRDEAAAWREWLLRAVAGDPAEVQIMYGVAGERRLDERELEWLPGFAGSRPVRDRQRRLDASSSSTSTARCWTPPTRRSRSGVDRLDVRLGAAQAAARLARGGLAGEGRGHLGGARAARATSPTRR